MTRGRGYPSGPTPSRLPKLPSGSPDTARVSLQSPPPPPMVHVRVEVEFPEGVGHLPAGLLNCELVVDPGGPAGYVAMATIESIRKAAANAQAAVADRLKWSSPLPKLVDWKSPFVVLRRGPQVPRHELEAEEGKWYDRNDLRSPMVQFLTRTAFQHWTAQPTGRFEIREDGQIAQVYEIGPFKPDQPAWGSW